MFDLYYLRLEQVVEVDIWIEIGMKIAMEIGKKIAMEIGMEIGTGIAAIDEMVLVENSLLTAVERKDAVDSTHAMMTRAMIWNG